MRSKILTGFLGFIFVLSLFVLSTGKAEALTLGTNITIWDRSGSGSDWYGVQEDQEVALGMPTGQSWDLEGFFLNGDKLFIVGGMNFANDTGQNNWRDRRMGDIFFDLDGDVTYGPDSPAGNGTHGYEYALRLLFYKKGQVPGTYSYDLYQLSSSSVTLGVHYSDNRYSNPWRLKPETVTETVDEKQVVTFPELVGTGTFNYHRNLDHGDVADLLGDVHYAVELSLTGALSFLDGASFMTHLTPSCGNDNLMGFTEVPIPGVVPIPGAVILLGSGLIGLAGVRRKFIN